MHTALIAAAIAAGVTAAGAALPSNTELPRNVRTDLVCSQTTTGPYATSAPACPGPAWSYLNTVPNVQP